MLMPVNVIDLEATCWRDKPPKGQKSEIIEVGICVIDFDDDSVWGKNGWFVRPEHSQVSEFCTELTGITPATIEARGITLEKACELLTTAYNGRERPWISWGDYDMRMLKSECAAKGVDYPLSNRHVNLKRIHGKLRGVRRGRRDGVGMDRALEMEGLPLDGRHHSGADDAWNIGRLALHLGREALYL